MAFLALGFPFLAALMIVLILLWLFVRRKIAFFLLLVFFAGYKNLFAAVGLNFHGKKAISTKDSNSLRILTWNVASFSRYATYFAPGQTLPDTIFSYIKNIGPDILCFQEFSDFNPFNSTSNTTVLAQSGYRYYYTFHPDGSPNSIAGTTIFSKLPLLDTGKTMLGDPSNPEYIAHADVLFNNKRLRIFTTHLKSIALFIDTNVVTNLVVFHGDPNFVHKATKFEKLKVFAQDHARQVLIAKAEVDKSPYPIVFTADMNSVPTSYPYHVISKGLQDAFVVKGRGLGGTMDQLPPTLRIDLMLADKRLKIKSFFRDSLSLSDHFPQVMDVEWRQ
jgi:endonuclease/exonuclease/phosphatase family metal-dependent hydrolase